uniref:Uncharacterized protein n=1 Tax=Amphimedon queenslandica TaxID=400682 RepID=A0A1X7U480_AMPQE
MFMKILVPLGTVRGFGKHDKLSRAQCYGVKKIESKIRKENQLDDKDQKDPLVIYTYIPLFDSLSSSAHFTPYLVDSPGVEVINDDVKSYYSILSAMVYVESYQRLLQNEENIKKELGFKPKDASLYFAVSQFDKYYTSYADEENPDEEETKDKVKCNLKLVKREEVFPVSGEWALRAHLARRYKEKDEISRGAVEEAYNKIPNQRVVVQTRNIADSGFTSEPSRTITGFVRNRTRNWRILNSALAAASAGASVLATGAGFMTAIALNILAVPVILSSGVIISGLSGTAYFIRQFINTTDQSMELSEEDVVTLCDQIKSDIRINSAGRIKQKFEQVVEDALRDYNRLLKAKYDREWGQRLNQCLEEAQVSLTLICKEKTDLTQACDELRQYSDSLKVLVQETE